MIVALSETSPMAREILFRRLMEMSSSERIDLGVALWEAGDSVQRAAQRSHLGQTNEEITDVFVSLAEMFEPVRAGLERAEIRFAVGGAWASTAFGEPRFTSNLDILAEFIEEKVQHWLHDLPAAFSVNPEEVLRCIQAGAPFQVVHLPMAFNFQFFPADGIPIGAQELDRAIFIAGTALSKAPVPFVTAEDILLAKIYRFKPRAERSDIQLRDIEGIIRSHSATLDRNYLEQSAGKLEVRDQLDRALSAI